MKHKILAIIPARAGSKRLPGKNIKDFGGKPLIAWAIQAAKQSRYISKVLVSTDSDEVASVSRKFGADVPFLRPNEIAGDTATIKDVILHALREMEKSGETFEHIILLQPTSPLRTADHIDQAFSAYFDDKDPKKSLVSVFETEYYYELMFKIDQNELKGNFLNVDGKIFTQQMSKAVTPNGCIYIRTTESFREHGDFYSGRVVPYVMSVESSADIDTQEDFDKALQLLSNRQD